MVARMYFSVWLAGWPSWEASPEAGWLALLGGPLGSPSDDLVLIGIRNLVLRARGRTRSVHILGTSFE